LRQERIGFLQHGLFIGAERELHQAAAEPFSEQSHLAQ
jgi:hypothetical protein